MRSAHTSRPVRNVPSGKRTRPVSILKRKSASGAISWGYRFDSPASKAGEKRVQVCQLGFAQKKDAVEAEAKRRLEVIEEFKLAQKIASRPKVAQLTLRELLNQFLTRHCIPENVTPTTKEGYAKWLPYLSAELLDSPLEELTTLHFYDEWRRMLRSGGHTRGGTSKPLSAKTVRNIAGFVSSAYARSKKWGIKACEQNPVTNSEPPIPKKREGAVLDPQTQSTVIMAATGPWCINAYLETCAGLGARRGEVLALTWSSIVDGVAKITRSLSQTKAGLSFGPTKGKKDRNLTIPGSTMEVLEKHRVVQNTYKEKFGADYRHDLDLIFCAEDGSPLNPDSISSTISQLCKKLKLPKGVSLHTLRHSHGSHLLANGAELIDVSVRLGHGDVRVTAAVYSHGLPGRDRALAEKWDAFRQKNVGAWEVKQ